MSDLVLMQCKECGWIHEAFYPSLDFKDEHKYLHCHNCFGDYTEFEVVRDDMTINMKKYKPGVKILVD